MRARLAIQCVDLRCELREVVLRDKPPSLLDYSPKATVPVLVLEDGVVIDESLDIMFWALEQRDPAQWLSPTNGTVPDMRKLIDRNDTDFKGHLDRYKYPNRYEDVDPIFHRGEAEKYLSELNERIDTYGYLYGDQPSLADYAIGPFVRQFANTNREWFDQTEWKALKSWLDWFIHQELFLSVMKKYPQWHADDEPLSACENVLIVSLSLGAQRKFNIKRIGESEFQEVDLSCLCQFVYILAHKF